MISNTFQTSSLAAIFAAAIMAMLGACSPPPGTDGSTGQTGQTGQSQEDTTDMHQVHGTVTYRERMALTPAAELLVQLLDVSRADAPSTTIAETRIKDPGQVPIEFTVDFDPKQIDERMSYTLRATISDNDQLLFTTDTHYPVLTRGNGDQADLLLIRVMAPRTSSGLTDTEWRLLSIRAEPLELTDESRRPHLSLTEENKLASGYAGCNRFSGGWQSDGDSIEFGNMAVTMMACADGNDTEQAFLQALGEVTRYDLSGERLQLLQDGTELLLFGATEAP